MKGTFRRGDALKSAFGEIEREMEERTYG